jgi:hypothetical protein
VDLIWKAHYQNGKVPNADHQKGSFWWKDCVKLQSKFKEIFQQGSNWEYCAILDKLLA